MIRTVAYIAWQDLLLDHLLGQPMRETYERLSVMLRVSRSSWIALRVAVLLDVSPWFLKVTVLSVPTARAP